MAPELSVIVPLTLPVVPCADATVVIATAQTKNKPRSQMRRCMLNLLLKTKSRISLRARNFEQPENVDGERCARSMGTLRHVVK
jgi:hypothetical protein